MGAVNNCSELVERFVGAGAGADVSAVPPSNLWNANGEGCCMATVEEI